MANPWNNSNPLIQKIGNKIYKNKINYLEKLPVEIIKIILDFLDYKNKKKFLFICKGSKKLLLNPIYKILRPIKYSKYSIDIGPIELNLNIQILEQFLSKYTIIPTSQPLYLGHLASLYLGQLGKIIYNHGIDLINHKNYSNSDTIGKLWLNNYPKITYEFVNNYAKLIFSNFKPICYLDNPNNIIYKIQCNQFKIYYIFLITNNTIIIKGEIENDFIQQNYPFTKYIDNKTVEICTLSPFSHMEHYTNLFSQKGIVINIIFPGDSTKIKIFKKNTNEVVDNFMVLLEDLSKIGMVKFL